MRPSLSLPPLECCFGTSPIQAEKSRPERNAFGSAILATKAVARAGPTPGTSSSRLLVSLTVGPQQAPTFMALTQWGAVHSIRSGHWLFNHVGDRSRADIGYSITSAIAVALLTFIFWHKASHSNVHEKDSGHIRFGYCPTAPQPAHKNLLRQERATAVPVESIT